MNLIKILMTLFLVASCSFPTIEYCEICSISISGEYCRCAMYDFNEGQLKAVSESENKPLMYCNRFIGMPARDWVKVVNYLDEIYTWKKQKFKRKLNQNDVIKLDQNEN